MKAALAKRRPRTAKNSHGDDSRPSSQPQPQAQPSAADRRNAMLARAVLEVGALPEPAFAWWLYHDQRTRLLAIRVLIGDELAHFPGGGVLNPGGSLRPNPWVIGLRSSLNF
jgi:hypothetical protein